MYTVLGEHETDRGVFTLRGNKWNKRQNENVSEKFENFFWNVL